MAVRIYHREIRATATAEVSLRNRIKTCLVEFEGKRVEEKEFEEGKDQILESLTDFVRT